ncbi:MAG: Mth938-like domain-containing protein [Bacteriovorax sp.]|nr:Mth938-like domain-containing protein [Rhizobacter sp.]
MKLQADRIEGLNAVSRHGTDGVIVNGVEHRSSVLVPWQGEVVGWPIGDFALLEARHFEMLAEFKPELVIFGSGSRIRFPKPALVRPLIGRRIGIETMDTAAASRTYNVLLAEGRTVLLALLFETAPPSAARV